MAETTIGVLHPGEMGAAIGAVLRGAGHDVVWASAGRSSATARRAEAAGFDDAGTVAEVVRRAGVILSVCPPHAALDVAREVAGFGGVYVDANAVSAATSRAVGEAIAEAGGTYVDGGIIGSPPTAAGTTRLYLSGPDAPAVAELFDGTIVDARVLSGPDRRRLHDEDGLRRLDEGRRGTPARRARARARDRARGRAAGRLERVAAAPSRDVAPGRPLRRGEGLALDGRDGGDRRHVRGGRAPGRIPPRRGGGLPALAAARRRRRGRGDARRGPARNRATARSACTRGRSRPRAE